ncbi:MAG TPA: hypothetical protein VM759_07345, partial [Longimicrobium sp.]|nr:hypothetical protein [Longimicrobium sp.]
MLGPLKVIPQEYPNVAVRGDDQPDGIRHAMPREGPRDRDDGRRPARDRIASLADPPGVDDAGRRLAPPRERAEERVVCGIAAVDVHRPPAGRILRRRRAHPHRRHLRVAVPQPVRDGRAHAARIREDQPARSRHLRRHAAEKLRTPPGREVEPRRHVRALPRVDDGGH